MRKKHFYTFYYLQNTKFKCILLFKPYNDFVKYLTSYSSLFIDGSKMLKEVKKTSQHVKIS